MDNMINICPVCDKIFASNGNVKRHLVEVHDVRKPVDNRPNRKRVPCEYCHKTFFDKSSLNKHLRSVHNNENIQEKSPPINKSRLLNKYRGCSKDSHNRNWVSCEYCNKTFFNKSALHKHLRNVHKSEKIQGKPTLNAINKSGLLNKCLDCSKQFDGIKDLLHHLTIKHNFIEQYLEENFSILEEFYIWLTHIEQENKFKYILKKGICSDKSYSRLYYECNRSGIKPKTIVNRKRCQKFQGSKKIGVRCPSHLVVKVNKVTKAVHVKYWKTHYGHDIQIQHIAGKLLLDVSVPKTIDSIRDGIGNSNRNQILNHVNEYVASQDDIESCLKSKQNIEGKKQNLQEQIESCLKGNQNIEEKKQYLQEQIISTALELVTLASNPVSSEILSSAYKQLNVAKSLLQLAEVPDTNYFKFQNTESNNESSNKKIRKQATLFSTKRNTTYKNASEEIRKPTMDERSKLELGFSKQLEVANSSLNDHTYVSFKL